MVYWKGKLEGDVGYRAEMLDRVESFAVPNFFVINSEEVSQLFSGNTEAQQVLNSQLNESMKSEIKDAYGEIGMSSEVRNANGKAKNLVGGQRDNQLVSVRVSSNEPGEYEHRLNVGASKLMEAVKQVSASYYERNDDHPAIIVQKMVEPDFTGAAMVDYLGDNGLIEVASGLGTSLEDGIVKPHLYLLNDGQVQEVKKAEEQVRVSRNPVNGEEEKKKVSAPTLPFSESEAEEFFQRIERENLNVKFVHKRDTFHVVDAWKPDKQPNNAEPGLQGLRVSRGEINGEAGRNIIYTDQTVSPEKFDYALICRKGGYTSKHAQKARRAGKPAIFSFEGDLKNGQQISLGPDGVNINGEEHSGTSTGGYSGYTDSGSATGSGAQSQGGQTYADQGQQTVEGEALTGAEVLSLNPRSGRGVFVSPPFGKGYAVTDREVRGAEEIESTGYLTSYGDVFSFEGYRAVLDVRNLERDGLENAIRYLEADLKVLVASNIDSGVLEAAVEAGFDVYATDLDEERLEQRVSRAEKRFMLEKLRKLDSN